MADQAPPSLSARFQQARGLLESGKPEEAVDQLEALQKDVASVGLFSSNESIDDVSTPSLALLSLDHQLAMAYTSLPTPPGQAKKRKAYLTNAMDHYARFLEMLVNLEELSAESRKEYDELLQINADNDDTEDAISLPPVQRDVKIQRFRAKQALQKELDQFQSLSDRRNRLGLQDEDEMDGYDNDGLVRKLHVQRLSVFAMEALEEWSNALREMPMIAMQLKMEAQGSDARKQRPPPPPQQPLKLTHITQDTMTGQLNIRKEEVRSQVFRPGWNQPTMSLEELGDREVAEAMEREARQKEAEEANKDAPRRYDQLVQDGMEDNAELVDASAALDRAWDEFRAENPKGSGNKMGDRGDRNF